MRLTRVINEKLHPFLLRYQDLQFRRKNRRVRVKHPDLFAIDGLKNIDRHIACWQRVNPNAHIDPSWYIMHANLSGVDDYRYVPENIYFPYVEPVFNDLEFASSIADKNRLQDFVPASNVPKTVVRYMRGTFWDENLAWLNDTEAQHRVDEYNELVIKPSVDSSGGGGVELWDRKKKGRLLVRDLRRFGSVPLVLQERIDQHQQSAVFNNSSVNTCRIMTMRCPWNGEVVVLKSMLRIGCGESICDNMMMGGVCLGVMPSGMLTRYAYDYDGKRLEAHPLTGLKFANHGLPLYGEMCKLALDVAQRVPYMNLLSFDMVADCMGKIICLEMNTAGQGITQLQYDGVPLFREYTEQVINYCAEHQDYNRFRHFRTFYW